MLIVTIAAHLAKPVERGKVIGNVMSGLLIGILLFNLWLSKSVPDTMMSYGKLLKSPVYNLGAQEAGLQC